MHPSSVEDDAAESEAMHLESHCITPATFLIEELVWDGRENL